MKLVNNPYREFHPFSSFVPPGAEKIIIGSFPPIKLTRQIDPKSSDPLIAIYNDYLTRNQRTEKDLDFYYGSADNFFWKLLGDLHKQKLDNLTKIKELLITTNTAITDVIEISVRKIFCKKSKRALLPAEILINLNEQVFPKQENNRIRTADYVVNSGDSSLCPLYYRDMYSILRDNREIRQLIFTGKFAWQLFAKAYPDFSYADRNKQTHTLDGQRLFETIILLSPSGSANKSIGGLKEYQEKRAHDPQYNTYQYRLDIYRQLLVR